MRFPLCLAAFLSALFSALPARADSADACRRLSEAALITDTKTLLIAVEGLFSFNASATERAYNYRCSLVRGFGGQKPSLVSRGFVLKNLVVPAIEKYKNRLQVVVVSQAGAENKGSKAYHCARAWMEESRATGRRVILMGHSFGGYAVTKLAENLGSTPIAGVITIDPRHRVPTQPAMFRRGKVARWENFYQRSAGLPGYKIHGADGNSLLSGRGHTSLPGHPAIKAALEKLIGNAPGPELAVGAISDCRLAAPSLAQGRFTRQGMAGNERMQSLSDVSGTRRGGLLGALFPFLRRDGAAAGRPDAGDLPSAAKLAPVNDNRAFTYRGFGGREFTLPPWWNGRSMMGERPKRGSAVNGASAAEGEAPVPEALAAAYPDAMSPETRDPAAFIGLPGSEDLQQGSLSEETEGTEDSLAREDTSAFPVYAAGEGPDEPSYAAPLAATGASAVVKGLLRQTASAENDSLFERVSKATRRHFP